MDVRSDAVLPQTTLGRVQVYLGPTDLADAAAVRRYRDLFGGVTLQGLRGLRIAQELHRDNDLDGVDLDPAAYVSVGKTAGPQLCLDLDVAPLDWVRQQHDLGMPVVRTAGHRISAGHIDQVRAALAQPHDARVSVQLVLDGTWLGAPHVDSLESALVAADRDVSLVLAGVFNPADSIDKVSGLRRLLRWARTSGRRFDLLRTDLAGVAAITEGAHLAAMGLRTSTRHYGLPFGVNQRKAYEQRQRSPLVFVPRLLHWQRGAVLGALTAWRGAGITDCDCAACGAAGEGLLRFDSVHTVVPTAITDAVREHDALALAEVVAELMRVSDPASKLSEMARAAVKLARTIASTYKVQLDPPPAWLLSWAQA